jgi:hypothetical protein
MPPTNTPLPPTDTPSPTPTSLPSLGLEVDAVSSGITDASSLSISHTTSGSERLMLVGVSINNDNYETVTSINYGAVPLAYVASRAQSDDARVEIWRLTDPPLGTHDVMINFSADLRRYAVAGVITFTGADQIDPLGEFSGANGISNSASVTIPSAQDDLILGVMSCESCNSINFTLPKAEHWNHIAGGGKQIGAGASYEGASISVNIDVSMGDSDKWALGGIAIKPASSSTPEPTSTPGGPPTNTPTPTPTTQPGSVPVIDSVSTGTTSGSSMSITHTTSGSDRLMLVGVSINNDNYETVTSVTYNGIPLTFLGSAARSDDARVEIWRLLNPPAGAHTVQIAFSANLKRYAVAGVLTFTGVDQSDPLRGFSGNFGSSNFASVTVPSGDNELVLGIASCENCDSIGFSTPGVNLWNINLGGGRQIGAGASFEGTGAQVIINAPLGNSDHWAIGGISIKPAGSQ